MTKKKVLIASILKPVDEPRMYKKLGLSIAELPGFEVHVAGYKAESEPKNSPINLHALFDFSRLSLNRLLSGKVFYNFLNELKPEILIVNTFELLDPAVRYKKHSKCVLICDISENQSLNITRQQNYTSVLRSILANYVRKTEKKYFPFVDHFILAERCYAREMNFGEGKFSILENKYVGEKLQYKNFNDRKIKF